MKSDEEVREASRSPVDGDEEGEDHPAVVPSRSVGDLRDILTDRRIELLQVLGVTESIAALVAYLDRAYRTVHDDVTLHADSGLLFDIEDGQSRRPYFPYDRIHLEFELVGRHPVEWATAA